LGWFEGRFSGSIFVQDKGTHRFAARPGHKAPQCGAFPTTGFAPVFGYGCFFRTVREKKLSVFRACGSFLAVRI
jgi:hypothetical protein